MGYVNITDICQFVPPSMILKSAGTWTPTIASNVVYDARTAADAEFTLLAPLVLPGSEVALQGAKIKGVDVWYRISTAAADAFATVNVVRMNLRGFELAAQGATIDVTLDADHNTSDKRKIAEHHKMTVSIDDPIFVALNRPYYLVMTVDAAAATVFHLHGCQVNYTLRI